MANRTPRRRARGRSRQSGGVASPRAPLATALHQICELLDELGAAYALVGGLAVSARVEPRLTRDVDLAVRVVDDAAAESLVRELTSHGYRVEATVEQKRTARLATVRLAVPGRAALVVDLLFASCGIEPEIVTAAERIEVLPGLTIPVASTAHLIAMKLLARDDRDRPQDLDDIRKLLEKTTATERKRVTDAIDKIAARGFSRGRDLAAAWKQLVPRRRARRAS